MTSITKAQTLLAKAKAKAKQSPNKPSKIRAGYYFLYTGNTLYEIESVDSIWRIQSEHEEYPHDESNTLGQAVESCIAYHTPTIKAYTPTIKELIFAHKMALEYVINEPIYDMLENDLYTYESMYRAEESYIQPLTQPEDSIFRMGNIELSTTPKVKQPITYYGVGSIYYTGNTTKQLYVATPNEEKNTTRNTGIHGGLSTPIVDNGRTLFKRKAVKHDDTLSDLPTLSFSYPDIVLKRTLTPRFNKNLAVASMRELAEPRNIAIGKGNGERGQKCRVVVSELKTSVILLSKVYTLLIDGRLSKTITNAIDKHIPNVSVHEIGIGESRIICGKRVSITLLDGKAKTRKPTQNDIDKLKAKIEKAQEKLDSHVVKPVSKWQSKIQPFTG